MVETKKEFAEREERRRENAALKRESAIEDIKSVHAMIQRANSDPDFVLNVDGLDSVWSQFKAEVYPAAQSGELRIMINSAEAAANVLRPARTASTVSQNVGHSSSVSDKSSGQPLSRLPEIPLPRFGIDFHLWPTFHDTFAK
ncbi:unnamed protein product [Macrosiphum euphorbiae]|uniref:Uncharacterized protein n=1 Tax=Macrosiphum euphorbiae TaxID=13131 RepID=A0AAV0XP30_9HEMI|nr:unnamed protein product [Macrosiphum euphorbiae]